MPHMTLKERIERAEAQHRLSFNRSPDEVRLCCWCGESLLIDYFQFGIPEMSRQIASFVASHDRCGPPEVKA